MSVTPRLEADVLHASALAALLQTRWVALGVTFQVYRDGVPDTVTPDNPAGYPYAVVWGAVGTPDDAAERLAGWGGEITTTNQITVAGLTSDDVLGAAGRCREALHKQRPTAAGRSFSVVTQQGGAGRPVPDPQRESGGQAIYALPLLFALRSRPNPAAL